MKKNKFQKLLATPLLWSTTLMLALMLAFVSCNDEEITPDVPTIEVDQPAISVTKEGGEFQVNVTANRAWNVEIPNDVNWILANPTSGSNNGEFTLTVAPNSSDDERSATIRVKTSTIATLITVVQNGLEVIWLEHMGTMSTSSPWPSVAEFTGWTKGGVGGGNATYEGTNTSVRTSVASSTNHYDGASGTNNIFFGGAPATFIAKNIEISGVATATLSFGISKVKYTTTNVWDPFAAGDLKVSFSTDGGTSWEDADWNFVNEPAGESTTTWALVKAVIPTTGVSSLAFKWECSVASAVRLDDMKLVGGGSGGGSSLSLSPSPVNASFDAGSTTVNVSSNTSWTVTPDASNTWCTVNTTAGSNNGSFVVSYTENTGTAARTATITVKTTDNAVTRMLVVKQNAAGSGGDAIWYEDAGTTATSSPYPLIAEFTSWTKGGSGGAGVTYEGNNASVRPSVSSAGQYDGASGPNSIFFGAAPSSFIVKNIAISGIETATLSFGASKVKYTTTNVWDPFVDGDLIISYSTDGGTTWNPTNWKFNTPPAAEGTVTWAVANTVVPTSGATTLAFKWDCNFASAIRIDDMKLISGGTVDEGSVLTLSPTTVNAPATAGSTPVNVTSNTSWTVTPDAGNTWCTVSPTTGSNNGALTISYTENTGAARTATITVKTNDNAVTRLLTVEQAGKEAGVLYYENIGNTPVSGNTNIAGWDGWLKQGQPTATYTSSTSTVNIRITGVSGGYDEASAGNNVFFGAGVPNSFTISGLNTAGATDLVLKFGVSNNVTTNLDTDLFKVEQSTDGNTWTPIAYTAVNASTGSWKVGTSGTGQIPASATLSLRFTCEVASTYRLDDIKILGEGGGTTTPTLEVAPSSLSFVAAGEAKTFAITSNTDWTVTVPSADTWCQVSPASGNNNGNVNVTTTANGGTTARSTTITISGTGVANKTVTVSQAATGGGSATNLLLNPSFEDFDGEVPDHWIHYTATPVKITTGAHDGANAIKITGDGATGNLQQTIAGIEPGATYEVSFWYKDNTKGASSSQGFRIWSNFVNGSGGNITPPTGDGLQPDAFEPVGSTWTKYTISVTAPTEAASFLFRVRATNGQTAIIDNGSFVKTSGGTPTPMLTVSPSSLSFVATGEAKTFAITSNTDWTVTVPGADTWCQVSPGSGNNNGNVSVTTTANSGAARNTTITISGTGVADKTVTVSQAATSGGSSDILAEWDFSLGSSSSHTVSGGTYTSTDGSNSALSTTATGAFNYVTAASPANNYVVVNGGWEAVDRYWHMEIPVTSYTGGDVEISFYAQSSGTGPRDFAVEWSANGSSWSTATAAEEYTLGSSSAAKSITITTSGLTNKLYLRLRVNSITNVNGTGNIATGGTSRITGKLTVEKAAGTPTPTLTVSPSSLSFVAAGEPKTFAITSNTAWTVTVPGADTWCQVSPGTGSNNGNITVTTTTNTGAARNTTITVSGTGVTNQTVTVSQDAAASGGGNYTAAWNMTGIPNWGDSPMTVSSNTSTDVTIGGLTKVGFTTSGSPGANNWGGVDFSGNLEANRVSAPVKSATFTMSSTKKLSVTELKAIIRLTATGPINTSIQYSFDGTNFTEADVIAFAKPSSTTTFPIQTIDLSGIAALQNITAGTTVTIRIVPYFPSGATASAGNWYLNSANATTDALIVSGTTSN